MTTTHPLFPLDGSETAAQAAMEIASIHVRRLESGKFTYAITAYAPEALESLQQLHQIYGGGEYMLEARDASHQFVRTRRLTLPGAPKPLSGEAPAPVQAAAAPAVAGPMDPAVMMLGMMERMMQFQQLQSQQTTQVIIAAMGRGDTGNESLNERRAELERQARTEYNQFVQMLLEKATNAAPGVGGNQESFMQGVEFAQGLLGELVNKQAAGEDPTDMLSTLKDLVEGLGQIGKATSNGSVTPPPPGAS